MNNRNDARSAREAIDALQLEATECVEINKVDIARQTKRALGDEGTQECKGHAPSSASYLLFECSLKEGRDEPASSKRQARAHPKGKEVTANVRYTRRRRLRGSRLIIPKIT